MRRRVEEKIGDGEGRLEGVKGKRGRVERGEKVVVGGGLVGKVRKGEEVELGGWLVELVKGEVRGEGDVRGIVGVIKEVEGVGGE